MTRVVREAEGASVGKQFDRTEWIPYVKQRAGEEVTQHSQRHPTVRQVVLDQVRRLKGAKPVRELA